MLGYLFTSLRPTYYSGMGITRSDVVAAAESATRDVEARIESLELACAGLWQLLKTKSDLTDEELMAAIHDVDMLDGQADGRYRPITETCPKCGHRLLARRSPKCSWCGAELTRGPFFEAGSGPAPDGPK